MLSLHRLGAASRKTVPSDTALLPYMFRGQSYRPSSHPDDPLVPVEPIARTEPDAPPRGCMLSHSSLVANLCQIEEPEGRHVSIGVTGKSLFDLCAALCALCTFCEHKLPVYVAAVLECCVFYDDMQQCYKMCTHLLLSL
jgi:hypothetical protein